MLSALYCEMAQYFMLCHLPIGTELHVLMNMCLHFAHCTKNFSGRTQVSSSNVLSSMLLSYFTATTARHRSRHSTGKRHSHSIVYSSSETTRRSSDTKSHDLCDSSVSSSSTPNLERSPSSLQRANRPPDLNLISSHVLLQSSNTSTVPERVRIPPHASTPEKEIANQIQDISLSVQPISKFATGIWLKSA